MMPYKDPEANRACQKKYYEENKEKVKARQKKYKEENPEKVKAAKKKYRDENPEKVKAAFEKWRDENPEKCRASEQASSEKYRANMKKTQSSVVYMIECRATNKYYIGQTSLWFTQRIAKHKSLFNRNKNPCGAGIMQDDYNKYGPDAFEYSVLKELDPQAPKEELLREEKNYIIKFIKEDKELYNSLA